jgi:SAM-dependent methyltransferase
MSEDDKPAAGRTPEPPAFARTGMVPTLNGTGFMFEVRDGYAEEFIHLAGRIADPVLDLGCAYGVATLPALEAGGTVVASDMEPQHLDILREKASPELRARLTCVPGKLPEINFPEASFGAILCSRVFHFLTGEEIDQSIAKIFRWLKPGGRFFLVADTPYGIWRKSIPEFEDKKRQGVRWPGFIVGLHNYIPTPGVQKHIDKPPYMNLMDADLLRRICEEAGFQVRRASYIDRADFRGLGRMDGRENVGCLALKPAP